MKQINNGYCDYYYLTKNGKVYNSKTKAYIAQDKQHRLRLKRIDNSYNNIVLKTLYKLVYNEIFCIDDIQDLDGEKWKVIDNTNDIYYVSNKGRIKSKAGYNARLLKPLSNNGYYRVDIMIDGQKIRKLIHRLVAAAFLPLPPNIEYQLHHKDFNSFNNCADNLEWLSISEHTQKHKERNKEGKLI